MTEMTAPDTFDLPGEGDQRADYEYRRRTDQFIQEGRVTPAARRAMRAYEQGELRGAERDALEEAARHQPSRIRGLARRGRHEAGRAAAYASEHKALTVSAAVAVGAMAYVAYRALKND